MYVLRRIVLVCWPLMIRLLYSYRVVPVNYEQIIKSMAVSSEYTACYTLCCNPHCEMSGIRRELMYRRNNLISRRRSYE